MKNNQAFQYVQGTWVLQGKLILTQPKTFLSTQHSLVLIHSFLSLASYANKTSTAFDSYLSFTAISNHRLFLLKAWLHHASHSHQKLFSFSSPIFFFFFPYPFIFLVTCYLFNLYFAIHWVSLISTVSFSFFLLLMSFISVPPPFTTLSNFLNSLLFGLQTWLFLCMYFLFAWIKKLKINKTCFEANTFFLSIPFFFLVISSTSFS